MKSQKNIIQSNNFNIEFHFSQFSVPKSSFCRLQNWTIKRGCCLKFLCGTVASAMLEGLYWRMKILRGSIYSTSRHWLLQFEGKTIDSQSVFHSVSSSPAKESHNWWTHHPEELGRQGLRPRCQAICADIQAWNENARRACRYFCSIISQF